MVSVGSFVTATATDGFGAGNSSEFSACAQVADTGPVSADLSVSVQNAPNPVTGGYDLGSTATVTNQGPGDATGVTLTDTLAPGESFVGEGSFVMLGGRRRRDVLTQRPGERRCRRCLIVTKTAQVSADTTIHDVFAASATGADTPDNSTLDVSTTVRAPSADFVAGYVPASSSTTWLSDATRWSHGDAVATMSATTVALVGIPGGGPGGPVTVTERSCNAPFVCTSSLRRPRFSAATGVNFGNLVDVSVPAGYGAANPITGVFLDNWSELDWVGARSKSRSSRTRAERRASCPDAEVGARRSSVRGLDRPVVPVVEPLRVRRPPHRRAVHRWRNIRARPIGAPPSPQNVSLQTGSLTAPGLVRGRGRRCPRIDRSGGARPVFARWLRAAARTSRPPDRHRRRAEAEDRRRRVDCPAHVRDDADRGLDRPSRQERGRSAAVPVEQPSSHRLGGCHHADQ